MATTAKKEVKTAAKKAVKPTTKPEAKKAAQVVHHRCIVRWRDEEGTRRQVRTGSETEAKKRVAELTKEDVMNPRYEIEA